MKIGLISDTHIDVLDKNSKSFQHINDAFDEFYSLCDKHNVDQIVHCGDMFHAKTKVSTEGLINIVNIIMKFSDVWPIYIIVGNHDTNEIFPEGLSLPQIFKGYKNVVVVDRWYKQKISEDLTFHYIPYQENPDTIIKMKLTTSRNYLFSHFGVNGATMTSGYNGTKFPDSVSTITPSMLKKFDMIYLGHYHGYQNRIYDGSVETTNIVYVSSSTQMKHTDEFSKHGFVIADTDNNTHKFIKNKTTPTFCTVKLTKKSIKKLDKLTNSYIKLIVPKKVSKEHIISLRDRLLKNNHSVTIEHEQDNIAQVAVVDGWEDIIKQDTEGMLKEFMKSNSNVFKKKGWTQKQMASLVLKE